MALRSLPRHRVVLSIVFAIALATASPLAARQGVAPPAIAQSKPQPPGGSPSPSKPATPLEVPKDYVIGVADVLSIVVWNAKELSADVLVRPDGRISLPLLNDLSAAGMTPEQLAEAISKDAAKYVRDPVATVMVKEIHSRKVYVMGEVAKPGSFDLGNEMTVVEAISEAGGFVEGAKKGDVVIVRHENGKEQRYKFNYNDFVHGKNVQKNIKLLPGDVILIR
jgi:polysaccharide export outer membrane protein